MSESPYFLIAEMVSPDTASFKEAMRSDKNRAASKDLMSLALDIVTLMFIEET